MNLATALLLALTHFAALGAGVLLRLYIERWWTTRLRGVAPRAIYDVGYKAGREARRAGVPELRPCERFVSSANGYCGRCGMIEGRHT